MKFTSAILSVSFLYTIIFYCIFPVAIFQHIFCAENKHFFFFIWFRVIQFVRYFLRIFSCDWKSNILSDFIKKAWFKSMTKKHVYMTHFSFVLYYIDKRYRKFPIFCQTSRELLKEFFLNIMDVKKVLYLNFSTN